MSSAISSSLSCSGVTSALTSSFYMMIPMQLSSPTISVTILPSPPATLVPDYKIGDGIKCLRSLSLSAAEGFFG
jgi:hypothetical protein